MAALSGLFTQWTYSLLRWLSRQTIVPKNVSLILDPTSLRRDTSACKPCFISIEYAAGIDLPDEVMSHPVMIAVEEAANDFITWSNVVSHSLSDVVGTADITLDRIFSLTMWSNLAMIHIILLLCSCANKT